MEREIIELRQRLAKSEDRDHQDDETKRHDYLSHEEGSEQYEEAPSPPPISRAQSHPSIIQRQSPTLSKLIQAPRPFGNAVSTSIKDEWSLENVSLSRARVVRLLDQSVLSHIMCFVCGVANSVQLLSVLPSVPTSAGSQQRAG